MVEDVVIFLIAFFSLLFFASFYEFILILLGIVIFGYGLEKNNNSAKNFISIFGAIILFTGIGLLMADFDEPGEPEENSNEILVDRDFSSDNQLVKCDGLL